MFLEPKWKPRAIPEGSGRHFGAPWDDPEGSGRHLGAPWDESRRVKGHTQSRRSALEVSGDVRGPKKWTPLKRNLCFWTLGSRKPCKNHGFGAESAKNLVKTYGFEACDLGVGFLVGGSAAVVSPLNDLSSSR